MFINLYWLELIGIFSGKPNFLYDDQTTPMLILNNIIVYIPFAAVIAVIILRLFKGKHFRVISYIIGSIIPVTSLIGFMIIGPVAENYAHSQSFNAEHWKNNQSTKSEFLWPPRLCMVNDLISSRKLDNLTKQEVISLLGKPDEFDVITPCKQPESCIIYYLGPERGFIRIDSEWLLIRFNKKDQIENYEIVRD